MVMKYLKVNVLCFACIAQNRKLGNNKVQHHNLLRQGKHK